MKKFVLCIVVAMFAAAVPLTQPAAGAARNAEAGLAISVDDVWVPAKGCIDHPYSVAITPTHTGTWLFRLEVARNYSTSVIEKVETTGTGPTVFESTVEVCADTRPNTYSIKATLNYDEADDILDFNLDYDLFEVELDEPRLTVTVSDRTPDRGQRIRIRVKARYEATGKPVSRGVISLEAFAGADWGYWNVPKSRFRLNERGLMIYGVTITGTGKFRVRLRPGPGYGSSYSRPVKLTVSR